MKTHVTFLFTLLVLSQFLFAAEPGAGIAPGGVAPTPPTLTSADPATIYPIPKLTGTIWENERLLGDLGGSRTWLADHGIQFDFTLVQIYQGEISGGDTNQWAINVGTNAIRALTGDIIDGVAVKQMQLQQQFKFSDALSAKIADGKQALNDVIQDKISQLNLGNFGNTADKKNDYFGLWSFETRIDTGKMGLWPGGFIFMRVQAQYGDSIDSRSGSLLPSNVDASLPDPNFRHVVIPALYMTQFLSEHLAIFAGKLDTTGGDMNEFAHISGDDRFLGTAFAFNPVVASLAPYSPLGVGAIILPNKNLTISLSAIDGDGVPTQGGFDTAFKGRTSYTGEARLATHLFGLPGHQLIGGAWGSGKYPELRQDLAAFVPGEGLSLKSVQNTWAMYYNFDQYFWTRPDAPDRGWGMFGRFGAADERTNPIGQFYSIGFGGKGACSARPNDRWGVGYYYMRTSRDLPNFLDLGSEQGEEVFYTLAVTPAFLVTADLEVTHSARKDVDTAVVGGLRATMRF